MEIKDIFARLEEAVTGLRQEIDQAVLFDSLGLKNENLGAFCGEWLGSGKELVSSSPIDGDALATIRQCSAAEYEQVITRAHAAFVEWRTVPAPRRTASRREVIASSRLPDSAHQDPRAVGASA